MDARVTVFAFLLLLAGNPACGAMRSGHDPFCAPHNNPAYPNFRLGGGTGNAASSRVASGAVFAPGQNAGIRPVADSRLKNAWRFSSRLFSGGAPEGDEAFLALRDLGIQTIISVESGPPDVERARKLGIRYIHLPIAHSGFPAGRDLELAKAVRDFAGPIYIHCSCGVDRAPTAAAVASVVLGEMTPDNAVAAMKSAGVQESFAGLYAAASSARKAGDQTLADLKVQFCEKAEVPALAKAMAAIRKAGAHLAAANSAEWKTPAGRADNETRLSARELLTLVNALQGLDEVKRDSDEFRKLLAADQAAVAALAAALQTLKAAPAPQELADLSGKFDQVASSCTACHVEFRDKKREELTIGRRGE